MCFAPVLSLAEAAAHPHNAARGLYRTDAGGGSRRPRRRAFSRSTVSKLKEKPDADPRMPQTLEFPVAVPPKPGEVVEVRPGIFWARLALPFRLDHVNLYLVEDGAGLALIDTGIDNPPSRAAWEALIDGPLEGAS